MSKIIQQVLQREGHNVEIHIEVDDSSPSIRRKMEYGPSRGDDSSRAEQFLEKGMVLIRECAEQVASTVRSVSQAARPDEVEVELGIKFDAEVGALISRTGVEANLQVKLKWTQKPAV